jgi:hypothetical protein
MASRRYLPRKYWEEKVQEWSASGESARQWCRTHQITYHIFLYWKKRFAEAIADGHRQVTLYKETDPSAKVQSFVELKDSTETSTGIYLECAGVKFHLSSSFDPIVLKRCLSVVRGEIC